MPSGGLIKDVQIVQILDILLSAGQCFSALYGKVFCMLQRIFRTGMQIARMLQDYERNVLFCGFWHGV